MFLTVTVDEGEWNLVDIHLNVALSACCSCAQAFVIQTCCVCLSVWPWVVIGGWLCSSGYPSTQNFPLFLLLCIYFSVSPPTLVVFSFYPHHSFATCAVLSSFLSLFLFTRRLTHWLFLFVDDLNFYLCCRFNRVYIRAFILEFNIVLIILSVLVL